MLANKEINTCKLMLYTSTLNVLSQKLGSSLFFWNKTTHCDSGVCMGILKQTIQGPIRGSGRTLPEAYQASITHACLGR